MFFGEEFGDAGSEIALDDNFSRFGGAAYTEVYFYFTGELGQIVVGAYESSNECDLLAGSGMFVELDTQFLFFGGKCFLYGIGFFVLVLLFLQQIHLLVHLLIQSVRRSFQERHQTVQV